jgi:hypothetical protein
MSRKLLAPLAALLLVGVAFAPAAAFAQTTVGYISVNIPSSGGTTEFDITGYTGSESTLLNTDPNPITTAVTLSDLSLTVGSSTFTLLADGVSYAGTPELASILSGVDSATLTGQFDETVLTLSDSTTETVEADFSATILGDGTDGNLQDGDFAFIIATPVTSGGGGPVTPEPEPFIMVGTGLTALAGMRRRFLMASLRKFATGGF